MNLKQHSGTSSVGLVIATSLISILITVIVGAVIITQYGRAAVVTEVSPFVETARSLVAPNPASIAPATEADQIMDGVAKNQGSSVLIYRNATVDAEFLGRGVLVTSNGYIVTDASLITLGTTYSIAVPGSKDRLSGEVVRVEGDIAVLKATTSTSLVAEFSRLAPSVNDVVVAVTGDSKMRIGTGIVTSVTDGSVVTNIFGTITPGSVLVSKAGYAIGLSTATNQRANEPAFKLLTATDIDRLTAPGVGQ